MLDAVQARADHRRVRQVGVHVAAGEAVLDVEAVAVADDPEAGRPVVAAPDDVDRRPRQRGVALVRVDVRGDEDRQLARQRHHPGHELAELLSDMPYGRPAFWSWVSGCSPSSSQMLMWRWPDEPGPGVVRLGHERDAPAVEVGDLLGAVLEQHAPVGRLEDVVVADVDLVLAGRRLALARTRSGSGPRSSGCGAGGGAARPSSPGGGGSPRCSSRSASADAKPLLGRSPPTSP